MADNKLGSTGSRYSSTPFKSGKGMSSYYSKPHDHTDTYKASIFYGFVAPPPPVRNTNFSFFLLSFYSPTFSTILPSFANLDGDLPEPQCCPGIWHLLITIFFSTTMISLMPLSSVLFCVSVIVTVSETVSPSDALGGSLDIFGTIISILNFSHKIPLTKVLLLVIIEALIFAGTAIKKMVLRSSPSPRARDNVTGFPFTTEVFCR